MKRILKVILITILLIVFLSSCDSTSVKSEKKILEDLQTNNYILETYPNYSVEDVVIVKRQTDIDNKLDKVYVDVTVLLENEVQNIEGHIDLILYYGLYDSGWILDNCEPDLEGENKGAFFTPLSGYEIVNIEETLKSIYGDGIENVSLISRNTDLENRTDVYVVRADDIHLYCKESLEITIHCELNIKNGIWEITHFEDVLSSKWNIEGSYYLDDDYYEYPYVVCNNDIENLQILSRFEEYGEEEKHFVSISKNYKTSDITLKEYLYSAYPSSFSTRGLSGYIEEGYNVYLSNINYNDYEYVVKIDGDIWLFGKDDIVIMYDWKKKHNHSIELLVLEPSIWMVSHPK